MNKMVDACSHCKAFFGCYYNDFARCPKIEMAAEGLGVPFKPVDTSYIDNIPFGVYKGLKRLVSNVEGGK